MVVAHPSENSFTCAVADATRRGLERGGHDVTTLDLYRLGFAPAMSREERAAYHEADPLIDPMTAEHAALVQAADALVFVYPTWWSGPPAVLKGWLERVLVPGVAFRFDARGKIRPALTNIRRIVGISTYGSPWLLVKLLNDGGRRMLRRTLWLSCGWRTRTSWLGLYSVDTLEDEARGAFVDGVEHALGRLR